MYWFKNDKQVLLLRIVFPMRAAIMKIYKKQEEII